MSIRKRERQFIEWNPTDKNASLSYKINIFNWLSTHRSAVIITITASVIFTTGAPWWLQIFFNVNKLRIISLIIFLFSVISIVGTILFVYFRNQGKIFDTTKEYNNIIHYICNNYCKTLDEKILSKGKISINLESVIKKLCEYVCKYFQKLKRSDKIGTAVRIAVRDKKNEIMFKTFGRSNLSEDRAETSQNIPLGNGIPGFFKSKDTAVRFK
jgi:hypothetical protein